MSIMELGALGEFIGAFGVIFTLFYLALQIRASTRATKAMAGFQAAHSWAQLNEQVGLVPDETVTPFVGMFEESFSTETLTDAQHFRLVVFLRAIFQKLEGQHYLFKYGLLDPELWNQRSSIGRGMIEPARLSAWWAQEKQAKTFSEEFVEAIEQANLMQASAIMNRF